MKKYFLLLLLGLVVFSCKDKDEFEQLKEGLYAFDIIGKTSCTVPPDDYTFNQYVVINKIDDQTYECYVMINPDFISPKSRLKVYDDNKIRGEIYTYARISWYKGILEGTIKNSCFEGSFKGKTECYQLIIGDINGSFSMVYDSSWP